MEEESIKKVLEELISQYEEKLISRSYGSIFIIRKILETIKGHEGLIKYNTELLRRLIDISEKNHGDNGCIRDITKLLHVELLDVEEERYDRVDMGYVDLLKEYPEYFDPKAIDTIILRLVNERKDNEETRCWLQERPWMKDYERSLNLNSEKSQKLTEDMHQILGNRDIFFRLLELFYGEGPKEYEDGTEVNLFLGKAKGDFREVALKHFDYLATGEDSLDNLRLLNYHKAASNLIIKEIVEGNIIIDKEGKYKNAKNPEGQGFNCDWMFEETQLNKENTQYLVEAMLEKEFDTYPAAGSSKEFEELTAFCNNLDSILREKMSSQGTIINSLCNLRVFRR